MPSPTPTAASGPKPQVGRTSLLDVAPALADGLPEEELHAAGNASVVHTVEVPSGPWSPLDEFAHVERPVGLLVADGLIVRDVLLASSTASDLLGPGDVAALGPSSTALVPAEVRWTASVTSRVAVLDDKLLTALNAWPAITARLLAQVTRQTSEMALQRAFSQLPRVEQRLLALFWHLAERWGRVGTDGIVVHLAVTHEALGRMVGSRRPTVSLALKELASTGTVVRRADGAWLLRQDGLEQLRPADAQGWQPPETALVPRAEGPSPPPPPDASEGAALQTQLRELGLDYTERERRVKEVLARCAATREQLIAGRRRREAIRSRRSQAPPPR